LNGIRDKIKVKVFLYSMQTCDLNPVSGAVSAQAQVN